MNLPTSKLFLIAIGLIFCMCKTTYAQQISIDDSLTPQQLIEDNLVQGCVQVSNISSSVNGSVNGFSSYGYFENANSNFPFQNGIVLSSGNVNSAGNVFNANPLNEGDTSWLTDPDLENALGITNTLNATSIEFDFISSSSIVQFNYILASEEYFSEYPCLYSDGFAFLIREAGTNDPYQNIAVIPGTSIPVNTNTVHDEIVGFCAAENNQYFEGYNIGDTNYNGRTTVMSASASITPNVQYNIKLVIADQTDRNFDSAVFIEGNSFTDSVNLGDDFSTCNTSTTLNADTNNPQATYAWYQDGTLLPAETTSNLYVDVSGSYLVEITVPLNNTTCTFTDEINISLNSIQTGPEIGDFSICDDASNDGTEFFDLTTLNSEVLAGIPASNYAITYHLSNQLAIDNVNPFSSINNVSSPQTIYIRAEDLNSGCVYISTVTLIVNSFPIITDPDPIEICSNESNDVILTDYNDDITNTNPNLNVTYHYTQNDADNGVNAIPSPYTPASSNEQLFIRIVDITTGCTAFSTVMVNTLDSPLVNTDTQLIDACEQDDDGFDTFDITSVITDVLQGLSNVTVTYHTSIEDAESGANPIANPTAFDNTVPFIQTVYIRVENNSNTCYTIVPVELHAFLLLTGTSITDYYECDDASNHGIVDFDLYQVGILIINGIPDVTIEFYETIADQTNGTNPIDQMTPYVVTSAPQTLYITLTSSSCTHNDEISLIIFEGFEIQNLVTQNYCDTNDDGFTSIDLESFNDYVSTAINNPVVTYFETNADAQSNTNPLPQFYSNPVNPLTVYVRVANSATSCYDISALQIEVLPAPTVTPPSDFITCDDDQDGFSIIDLTSKTNEIVTNTTGLEFSFFPTEDDANANTNEIINSTNYNTQTASIIVKVENQTSGCYALVPINVLINTLPEFIAISNYKNCETDGNQIAEFLFSEKDEEILNGQTGKEVSYYETGADALNGINSIDKNSVYENISTPQTIYVRVENITDTTCFSTTSFVIEVGSEPIYDAPLDVFICDDISNDGFETFNLNDQITAISQNSPENLTITFYATLEDAENVVNPLPETFTNTTNPQQIFVLIDNGTYCKSIATYEYNIVQIPDVNSASTLQACDTDLDGSITFDLTVAEFEVLGIRQDNTVIIYYENEADLNSGSNAITDPTNYVNTSNPQTVYIQVANTVSNCSASVPIELVVDLPPTLEDIPVFVTCDNENGTYDLNETITPLIGDQQNVIVTFHSSMVDAESAQNVLDTNYLYATNSDTIFVRAEFSDTNCININSFTLQVNPLPVINPVQDLVACDDNFDGLLFFDLSQQTSAVLGAQNPNDFTVSYFETEGDATNNENPISNLNYEADNNQSFFIRVENNVTGCFDTTTFTVIINRKPYVEVTDQVICLDNLPLVITAETEEPTDTYLWSTNATSSIIEITQIGDYWVTVTSASGCTTTSNFNVSVSEAATIEFTETVDFSDPNNITVTVSGIGEYLYQFDDEEPQESNFFGNVPIGPHVITVIDLNGCNSTSKDVVIIDTPQFVTPNGDGYFDTWHITGVRQLPGTIVSIFDRYGKLITILKHNSYGWDGTYNGNNMPATDYWFVANVVKGDLKFNVNGHFTLRR